MRRRSVLAGLAAGLAVAGCGRGASQPESGRVVNLYNWYEYLGNDVLQGFETGTGIRARYDTFDSNQTLEAKLLAGHSGYDVVFPSAATLQRLAAAGAFQALDRTRLPNYGNLDPRFLARLTAYDAGNRLALPYTWGITGLGIDVARVRALAPDAPLDSWSLVLDPAVAARLSACGIALYDSPTTIFPSTLAWLGLPPTGEDPALLDRAGEALQAIRPHLRKVSQGSLIEDLASGEMCVTLASDGDVRQARERAHIAGRDVDLRFVAPREGATLWFDVAAIPADAPHPDEAHRFLDYLLQPGPAAANTRAIGFANANAASQALLPPELRNDALFPRDEAATRFFAEVDHGQEYVRQRTRWWTRVRTGVG
jgi:putrescine transport system substrate-binding protein